MQADALAVPIETIDIVQTIVHPLYVKGQADWDLAVVVTARAL